MEIAIIFGFCAICVFLSFWVRNLIVKLKTVARKRQEVIDVLYSYIDELDEIQSHEMWSGEPMFRKFKIYTEKLVRYLQTDHIHGEIKFLYDEEKEK